MNKSKSAKLLKLKEDLSIWKFLILPVVLYAFMIVIPLALSIFYSMFDWGGGPVQMDQFTGFENYRIMFRDRMFWESFGHSMEFTVLLVVGQIALALFFTLFFSTRWLRFVKFHRFVIFLPVVISPVVIGLMWQMIYNRQFGLLNWLLRAVGLQSWIRPWLDDPKIALIFAAIPLIWQYIGFYFVVLTSAVSAIPGEVLESAELDGATGVKKALHIQIPMIYDTLGVCIIISVIGSLRVFDHVMVMTYGGPGTKTQTMALYAYNVAFNIFQPGYANTLAIGILVLTVLVTFMVKLVLGRKKYD